MPPLTSLWVLLHPFGSRVQATVCFHLEGRPVHLESTAPGVETQSHHLPWADPDCAGAGWTPDHLQYIDNIIVWGDTAAEDFEKGEKIIQILLKADCAIKQIKVEGPAKEIQFLGIKWQDGCHQIPVDVINKIAATGRTINFILGDKEWLERLAYPLTVPYDKHQKPFKFKTRTIVWKS